MVAQYFAQIDDNNIVTDIAVVQQEFLEANPDRYTGTWVETFFDTDGKTYAGIGYRYLEDEQDFRTPQPYNSWTLDENFDWQPPTPMPTDSKEYAWFEANQVWIEILEP